MCGICGFSGPSDHDLLRKMTSALVHRGPDDSGFYEDEEVSLGVRRLSVVDVAGGHQPICNEDENVWTAFNGEIFNHRELREGAEDRHHAFRTNSDTEVLVHLWEDYGPEVVRYLRGMFAFAIYDRARHLLFLARDHFGKKPLYYATVGPRLYFASELRALIGIPQLKRGLNGAAISHYLAYFFNPLPESFIRGVYRLPPACTLTYSTQTGRVVQRQYWDPATGPKLDVDSSEAMILIEDRLIDAVRLRLESEVPLGVLLSGGVDSSIVTAIAAPLVEGLQTFHVQFEGAPSEAQFARRVADESGADFHELAVKTDPLADLPLLTKWIDEPVADPSVFPTFYICREARTRVTVCLTGLGGDELFRGYPWLFDRDRVSLWFDVPKQIRFAMYEISKAGGPTARAIASDLRKYEESSYASLDPRDRCVARLTHFPPNSFDEDSYGPSPDQTLRSMMAGVKNDSDARDYLTLKSVLPFDYLHKDDRLSMANSLELRSPMLDHVFVQLCMRLPNELKMRRGVPKYILKKFAVKRLGLPRRAIYRRKVGFAFPLRTLHRSMLPQLESMSAEFRLLPRTLVSNLVATNPSHENSGRVFAALMLLSWCAQNHVDQIVPAG
jgi:asparagine synthase (glutamine-hydrolysing)